MVDLTMIDWCDEHGQLTPHVMHRVQRALRKHVSDTCGFCGAATEDKWRIADSPCALPGFADSHSLSDNKGIVAVIAGCASCGNTLLFRLDVLLGVDPTI